MSKVTQFPSAQQIEAEGCAWIAQLDGSSPTKEDLDAFREWINRSPRHRQEIKRLSVLWSDLNILTELAVPLREPERKSGGGFRLRSAAIAAIAVVGIAFGVTYALWRAPSDDQAASLTYSTLVGKQESVALADGSHVVLNTDSRIQVSYSAERRMVHLLHGEAYFEVAHNPNRPFLVYVGANIVRAVGTAFTVRIKEHDVEVVVSEGTVELSSMTDMAGSAPGGTVAKTQATKLVAISAGQRATFNKEVESIQTIEAPEVTRRLSWREGVLSFSGEPLEQVVEEVSRYTPITIVITDPAIRNIKIGGYFKAGETDAMFEALETSFGVRVKRVNDGLVYLAAK